MSVAEILTRGSVDGEGEPSIGLVVSWCYGEAEEEGQPVETVEDFQLSFSETGESDDIIAWLHPFRTAADSQARLVAMIIAALHFQHVRRINPERPLIALENDELDALADNRPYPVNMAQAPTCDGYLERYALSELALAEMDHREDESNHMRLGVENSSSGRWEGTEIGSSRATWLSVFQVAYPSDQARSRKTD